MMELKLCPVCNQKKNHGCLNCANKELTRQLAEKEKELGEVLDAAEMLWVCLANVSGGDWSNQSEEWQKVVIRWRDNYFKVAYPKGSKFPAESLSRSTGEK